MFCQTLFLVERIFFDSEDNKGLLGDVMMRTESPLFEGFDFKGHSSHRARENLDGCDVFHSIVIHTRSIMPVFIVFASLF